MTLGSLFDGSGGFPLAGLMHGITPLWSSEIEEFPLRVTAKRFPDVKQLGDVCKINGSEIEPVDIITFGSPCQDLSVAGKQLGIHKGERSNLFFEAVRIIKEMREATNDRYPRYAVWENVPGAFSSNGGEDFKAVLEALASVRQDGLSLPRPKRWNGPGCLVGNGWSIAWRLYDAQYWGVPQRRKRIYLIADFRTERAGEILFECEGVPRDPEQGTAPWQGIAEDAEGSAGRSGTDKCLNPWDVQSKHIMTPEAQSEARCSGEKRWGALPPNVCYTIDHVVTSGGNCTAQGPCYYRDIAPTEKAAGPHSVCYALDSLSSNSMKSKNPLSGFHQENVARTLDTRPDPTCNQGGNVIVERHTTWAIEGNTVDRNSQKNGCGYCKDISPTLNTQDRHAVTFAIEGNEQRESHKGDGYRETDTMYTLNTTEQHAVCFQQNQREEVRDMGNKTGTVTAESGMHNSNYVCYGVDCRNGCLNEEKTITIQAKPNGGVSLNCTPSVLYNADVYPVENHPADSRCELKEAGTPCQTLTSRMGTGGGGATCH